MSLSERNRPGVLSGCWWQFWVLLYHNAAGISSGNCAEERVLGRFSLHQKRTEKKGKLTQVSITSQRGGRKGFRIKGEGAAVSEDSVALGAKLLCSTELVLSPRAHRAGMSPQRRLTTVTRRGRCAQMCRRSSRSFKTTWPSGSRPSSGRDPFV